jgi:hypothetical protein
MPAGCMVVQVRVGVRECGSVGLADCQGGQHQRVECATHLVCLGCLEFLRSGQEELSGFAVVGGKGSG